MAGNVRMGAIRYVEQCVTDRTLAQEIKKQAIDQPLHVLMALASVLAIGWPLSLVAPLWVAALASAVITAVWVTYREYRQWPSTRWWDPPLDALFEVIGLGLGIWVLLEIA